MIYLRWLLLFLGLPLIALWLVRGRLLWRHRAALGWTFLGAFVLGGAWDHLAVRAHIWYYQPRNIAGIWAGGLPIEEWLWIAGTSLMFATLAILVKERLGDA